MTTDVAPPLTLNVPQGGTGVATITCTTTTPTLRHSLMLTVSRNWVDFYIGSSSGGGEITQARFLSDHQRLPVGIYILTFTPNVATFYLTAKRDHEGLAAITDMQFVGVEDDLQLPTPWLEDDMRSLRSAQSRDIRWFWNYYYAPRALVRYGNDSWGLQSWLVDDGPFLGLGDDAFTLTPSARTGADQTLTANKALFKEDHVGALFQATHLGQRVDDAISGADLWSDPIRVTGVGDSRKFTVIVAGAFVGTVTLQQSAGTDYDWQDTSHTWTAPVASASIADGFDNAVIYYRLGIKAAQYTSGTANVGLIFGAGITTGVARVVSYTSPTVVTVDILVPFAAVTATRTWQEGAWSGVQGWPAAGDLFNGRLWLGSIINVFASTPDNLASFAVGAEDADAISRQMVIGDASPIRWLKGVFRLQVGTDAGVADIDAVRVGDPLAMQITSSAFDEPLTPTNMNLREMSAKVAFVDSSRNRIVRLTYDLNTNSFTADNLNRLHETIGFDGGGFIDLTYQARPQGRLWVPRADGQLALLTLAESEDVVGWGRMVGGYKTTYQDFLDGLEQPDPDETAWAVESVTATSGIDGTTEQDQDYVHRIVWRMIDGQAVRFHERIERERWRDVRDAWFLEAAIEYDGPPARYLYGLDHLFGENVYAWLEGAELGPFEVVDLSTLDPTFIEGEIGIDLGEDAVMSVGDGAGGVETTWRAIVGLPMRTRYLSGKLPYGAQAGSAVGEKKKGDHVTFLFHETALGGVRVGIVDGNEDDPFGTGTLYPILELAGDLPAAFDTDAATPLFSGELEVSLPMGTMRDPRIAIEFTGCAPAAVLGYVVNMTTQERP